MFAHVFILMKYVKNTCMCKIPVLQYSNANVRIFIFAVKRIRGAFKVVAYTDYALNEKVSNIVILTVYGKIYWSADMKVLTELIDKYY